MTPLAAGLVEGAVVGGGTVLFALVVLGAVALAFRGGRARVSGGELVMTYGWGYRGMALFVLGLGVALLGVAVAGAAGLVELGDVIWIPFAFGGLFTLGGAVMTVEGFRRQVVVGDDGLTGRGWFRGTGRVPWGEVTEVRYSQVLGAFVVEGHGRAVTVPLLLGGRDAFMKTCRRHLDKGVYGRVFKKYGKQAF